MLCSARTPASAYSSNPKTAHAERRAKRTRNRSTTRCALSAFASLTLAPSLSRGQHPTWLHHACVGGALSESRTVVAFCFCPNVVCFVPFGKPKETGVAVRFARKRFPVSEASSCCPSWICQWCSSRAVAHWTGVLVQWVNGSRRFQHPSPLGGGGFCVETSPVA